MFTTNWHWIEVCQNVVLSKIDFTMATVNKKIESRILRDLDLKIRQQELKVWCLANNLRAR